MASLSDRGVVASLSVHMFFSWGLLYYTLPLLNLPISQEYGWSTGFVAAVFSAGLLIAAFVGVPVGKLVDRWGPAPVMAIGSMVGVTAVAISATNTDPVVFASAWIIAGAAHSATLYPPAFVAVARWFDGRTTRPLTVVTLSGGSSSLVFAPLTAASVDAVGVRPTVALTALLYLLVALVTTLLLRRREWHGSGDDNTPESRAAARTVARSGRFIRLQVAMALGGAGLYAVTLNSVQLMVERGFSFREAASVFAMIGGGQLIGRLAFVPLSQLGTARSRSVIQAAGTAVAIVLMAGIATPVAAVAAAAVLAGAVRGAHTLATAASLIDRWGSSNYGAMFGRFNLVVSAAVAMSPVVGEALAALTGSYERAAWILAAAALLAVPLARAT